jgi:hypothetical protein
MTGGRPLREHLTVHIGELVLEGCAPGDRWRIADAIEAELRRLMLEQGWPEDGPDGRHVEHLPAGALRLTWNAEGARGIAARLWESLRGQAMPPSQPVQGHDLQGAAAPGLQAPGGLRGGEAVAGAPGQEAHGHRAGLP